MEQAGEWPIPIIATQDVACGVKLWSTAGRHRATVVVKATFYLMRGGPMRLVSPASILLGDQHHEGNVDRSVLAPSDMAPYLPRAEVLFAGHAYAPTPSPFVPIRFAVVGSRPLVDKTLHVYGERMWLEGDQTTAPVPFTRIPIRYERAYQGPPGFEENPVGMPKGPGLAVHNIIDPSDPEAAAGLGPIAPYWPPRRRLLRNLDPSAVQTPRPDLPDTFAWSFFHAAPPDQRCSFLEGNEWVVLEGLHPEHPRFESQLPSARGRARLYSLESTHHREIGLTADTLWIDGDHSMCCVLYRGNFELESGMLETVQLFAGLELPGRAIPWPDAKPSASQAPLAPSQAPLAPSQAPLEPLQAPLEPSEARQDRTLHSPNPLVRPPSGSFASVGGETPQRPPESYVRVDAAWLEEPSSPSTNPSLGVVAGSDGSPPQAGPTSVPVSRLPHTMTHPPSELRDLIQQTRNDELARTQAVTSRRVSIEDHPTVSPDTSDLARILAEADALSADDDKRAEPLGERPSPAVARAQKTTIRGLGTYASAKADAEPPPTARVATANLLQSEESPTAQLPIPEILLKLAAQPASTTTPGLPLSAATPGVPSAPISVVQAPVVEEDDTGRPTLSGMVSPPVSTDQEPQVHKDEARNDLERRIREGESLEGLDLSDLDLSGFDFSGKKLAGCRFDRSSLKRCRLRGTDLSGASLEGADLSEADLEDSLLERTNLVSAKLAGASLRRAFLTDANLTTADARRACFDGSSGQRTIFSRARLDGASALSVKLDAADFTEAQLDGANFEGSLLPDLRAYEVSAEEASFLRCTMQNARFDGAVVSRARFDGARVEDSMWDRSVLDGASFEGAHLTGASFTKASLRGTILSHSILSEARFNRANLNGARFIGVDLSHLTLDGADLTGVVTSE